MTFAERETPSEVAGAPGRAEHRFGVSPRFQVPRQFRDYEDFLDVADQLAAAAGVDDYTYIWWDVRPHPRLGTVEVRAVDVQSDPLASSAIGALVQAIAAKELDRLLSSSTLYLYFVVGVFSAALMPYEVHFYSSGAVEEGWDESSLSENRLNAIVGYGLGGLLACALVIVSGFLFHPLGVEPNDLGTVVLPAQNAFGEAGLLVALGGIMFCVGAAAIDSSFSASYNLAQFLG